MSKEELQDLVEFEETMFWQNVGSIKNDLDSQAVFIEEFAQENRLGKLLEEGLKSVWDCNTQTMAGVQAFLPINRRDFLNR
jgi:hypothetical protein